MILRELLMKLGLDVDEASFAKGNLAAEGIKRALEAVVDTAKELVHSFFENVNAVSEYGEKVLALSQAAGLSTTELQQLGKAAAMEGISMDEFGHSIVLLSRTMKEAKDGSEDASKSFSKMGIKITDEKGKFRSAGDVFEDIADHFSQMPDGVEKTATALKLFGRSGAEMITVLNQGREEIEKFRQAKVIDEEQLKAGKEIVIIQRQLTAQTKSLWREAIAPLLPAIRDLYKRWLEWKKANAEVMKQRIREWVGYLIKGINFLGDAFDSLQKNIGFVKLGLVGLGIAFAILKADAVAAAIGTAAAWAVALAPFLALGAVLAALYIIYDDLRVYKEGKGRSLYGMWKKEIDDWLKPKSQDPWFVSAIKSFVNFLRQAVDGVQTLKRDLNELTDLIADAFQGLAALADTQAGAMLGGKAGKYFEDRAAALRADVARRNRPAAARGNKNFKGWSSKPFSDENTGMSVQPTSPNVPAPQVSYQPLAMSPQAGPAVFAPQQQNSITVVQQPGQSGTELAKQISDQIDDHWQSRMEEASSGTQR